MKRSFLFAFLLALPASFVGCADSKPKADADKAKSMGAPAESKEETKIKVALAKLSPEDRAAAEAQKFCAVEEENRLGSMDAPIKLTIEGQSVFLCCDACKDKALKDPQATLAKVADLKAKNAPKK